MIIKLLILGGYGQFVWPAFVFAFAVCFTLYFKTKRELQKQEKLFLNEFKNLQNVKIKIEDRKKNTKEALSGSLI